MELNTLQELASNWSKRNFGEHYGSGYRNLLGVSEEVGELCHAQLKGEQGIRHTPDEILKMKKDAVGDILIFLCNYCDSQNINIDDCAIYAWNEIKDRDWKIKPLENK
jgi:NTP pyrophosphatase (non-canonical NTP hydrolase)